MTSEKLAELSSKRFLEHPKFDRLAKIGDKRKDGLKFAKNTHDVFGLKDNKNEGKELWETPGKDIWLRRKWEYKYITTIAYSGENKKKKNPYYPYYDDDKVNQNMFATTFVKNHPDFENIIPNKTKKDE